jgi:hypothetical protein
MRPCDHRQLFPALGHGAGQVVDILAGRWIPQGKRKANNLDAEDPVQAGEANAVTTGRCEPVPDSQRCFARGLHLLFESGEQRACSYCSKPVRGGLVSERIEGLAE